MIGCSWRRLDAICRARKEEVPPASGSLVNLKLGGLSLTRACALSHDGDFCPRRTLLYLLLVNEAAVISLLDPEFRASGVGISLRVLLVFHSGVSERVLRIGSLE